jgi:hypothetical protein
MTNTAEATGCIRHLRKAITTFKRQKLIASTVAGGIIGIEVTNTGHGWHPHAHLLIDCRWLAIHTPCPRPRQTTEEKRALLRRAHNELSREWAAHLKQPEAVVWVERAWGKGIMETVKYLVKPSDLIECKGRIGPLLREMHRQKAITGFGSCYGHGAEYDRQLAAIKPPCTCDKCGAEGSMMPDMLVGRYIEEHRGDAMKQRESRWMAAATLSDGIPY